MKHDLQLTPATLERCKDRINTILESDFYRYTALHPLGKALQKAIQAESTSIDLNPVATDWALEQLRQLQNEDVFSNADLNPLRDALERNAYRVQGVLHELGIQAA